MSDEELHHPSPNRTEAATAMMNLFAASATVLRSSPSSSRTTNVTTMVHSSKPEGDALKPVRTKRKYVRKASRRLPSRDETSSVDPLAAEGAGRHSSSASKRDSLSDSVDPDDATPKKKFVLNAMHTESSPEWKLLEEDVRYMPFREYNRKEKSLGLLCEK